MGSVLIGDFIGVVNYCFAFGETIVGFGLVGKLPFNYKIGFLGVRRSPGANKMIGLIGMLCIFCSITSFAGVSFLNVGYGYLTSNFDTFTGSYLMGSLAFICSRFCGSVASVGCVIYGVITFLSYYLGFGGLMIISGTFASI